MKSDAQELVGFQCWLFYKLHKLLFLNIIRIVSTTTGGGIVLCGCTLISSSPEASAN